MRSPQNVLESLSSKACNNNYQYQRLYRNLYNPEFYLTAYQKIQAKQGNMTAGTDGKTVDGMGMKRINTLIARLKDFSYQPSPARRTYIPKANGKKRPLGIPSFDDKLVQEVVRMILESIYEPTFLNTSHGFRPKRSCHTALQYVQKNFTGVKWFVEGDIKGCFDHVDHHVLVNILRRRIQDEHFIGLIWKFLKAGYMEDWTYHNTYSGTPQGSIISPILANIYLNELDEFMARYAQTFHQGDKRRINPAYKKPLDKRRGKQEWLKRNEHKISPEQKMAVSAEINEINQYLRTIPYVDPMDNGYKRLVYVRYADDFLIGVIGSKEDAKQVKTNVGQFIQKQLHLELSQEKTLITHGTDFARFLSFQITASTEQNSTRTKAGYVKRSYTGRIKLYVPKDKWLKRLLSYGALKIHYDKDNRNKEVWEPVCRSGLRNLDDLEILNQYNAEIRGLYNYYRIAHNATVLNNFLYVMKYSMYKTFAGKYRTSMRKIIRKYTKDKDFVITYQGKSGEKSVMFYNQGMRRDTHVNANDPDIIGRARENRNYTSLIQRLQGCQCEWCGATGVEIEIHHVKKLKDLLGRAEWERHMIARRRKTMALCHNCHVKLHAGKLD
ncbi:MAG: group II intron reverse transcriptase/maturase [Oscillospiraceae bacterium]|jgi:group II intron reverse transcriptase/maturase|nr:group II intron reverse transcriptase/maturase [Oscillospiraceae bacterium]